jgi:hypothetical protein
VLVGSSLVVFSVVVFVYYTLWVVVLVRFACTFGRFPWTLPYFTSECCVAAAVYSIRAPLASRVSRQVLRRGGPICIGRCCGRFRGFLCVLRDRPCECEEESNLNVLFARWVVVRGKEGGNGDKDGGHGAHHGGRS